MHDKAVINCQYSVATFSGTEHKNKPHGDWKSIEMTMHLKQTFEAVIQTEKFPKSQIDIYVEVKWNKHKQYFLFNTNLFIIN